MNFKQLNQQLGNYCNILEFHCELVNYPYTNSDAVVISIVKSLDGPTEEWCKYGRRMYHISASDFDYGLKLFDLSGELLHNKEISELKKGDGITLGLCTDHVEGFYHAEKLEEHQDNLMMKYQPCTSSKYPQLCKKEITDSISIIVHPIYLFRYFELCQFSDDIPASIVVDIFKDYYEEEQEETEETQCKKRKISEKGVEEKADEFRQEIDLEFSEMVLRLLHKAFSGDKDNEDNATDHVKTLNLCQLKENQDMLYCILEFIGDVRTLFKFARSCRLFYEIFQRANQNFLLFKRIMKDMGLIIYISAYL